MSKRTRLFKKRILSILISAFFILYSGCSSSNAVENIDACGKNIVFFGDSITSGIGADKGEDFPSLIAKKISVPIVNAGKAADTTFDALKRLEDILDQDPFIVVVEFGGNDYLNRIFLKDTIANLDKIVVTIQDRGAMVVLISPNTTFFLKGYLKEYQHIAKRRKAVLIANSLAGILDNPTLKSDHIHPNAQGYKILSERILKVLMPLIEKNKLLRKKEIS